MTTDATTTGATRAAPPMLFASTILARNASSVLSHLAHLVPRPLTPLYHLHQHPTASLHTRLRALVPVRIWQRRLSLRSNAPKRTHRVFVGILSDIPGRPEAQGSEVALLKEETVDWERVWGRSIAGDALPASLRELRSQSGIIVVIYPRDQRLFASSTLFVTGRPYTLIFNGSVKSSGVVGFALSAGPRLVPQTSFPGLLAISAPLKVTQLEGNLVSELDSVNPTELFISAMDKGAAKDDDFYLGVLRDGELRQVHHILTGALSRGAMALDTKMAPGEGTSVQLFHRPMSHHIAPAAGVLPKNTLAFVASPPVGDDMMEEEGSDEEVTVLEDAFVAASESGFMLSRGSEPTWTCVAPGAKTRLTW
ncbi:hypothetical protein EI94DRAFT_1707764 [Lactarius quietus]|nr:hypothetical protein EI94DRAFT_1707764 [Lactarius quietus]